MEEQLENTPHKVLVVKHEGCDHPKEVCAWLCDSEVEEQCKQ